MQTASLDQEEDLVCVSAPHWKMTKHTVLQCDTLLLFEIE